MRWLGGLCVAGLLGMSQPGLAVTVTNGDFEAGPDLGARNFVRVFAGSNAIPGWEVLSGSVDYLGPVLHPQEGVRWLDLDGDAAAPGVIATRITTVPGTVYAASFIMSGNPNGGDKVKQIAVRAGDFSGGFAFENVGERWDTLTAQVKAFAFQALDVETLLVFQSLTTPGNHGYGAVIDAVAVMETAFAPRARAALAATHVATTPLPAGLWLMLSALGLTAAALRRRGRR